MDFTIDSLQTKAKRIRKKKRYILMFLNVNTLHNSNLIRHIESRHEGVRYPCSECEFISTRANELKIGVESKHEGVRYPCPYSTLKQARN